MILVFIKKSEILIVKNFSRDIVQDSQDGKITT